MSILFENDRNYVLRDPEIDLIWSREKLAQWRHKRIGPPYYKLGWTIGYCGEFLNAWVSMYRTDPGSDVSGPDTI